jgi:hypothetical protein
VGKVPGAGNCLSPSRADVKNANSHSLIIFYDDIAIIIIIIIINRGDVNLNPH